MKAYILIKIRSGEIPYAVRQMRQVKGVVNAEMTFGPYDAIAIVEADDLQRIGSTVTTGIQSIPGVAETLTCLSVEV